MDSSTSTSTKTNAILVNPRQKGNPILKFIRNVPWQYAQIIPDFIVGETACVIYLSLRYHQLNQNYIHERLKELGHTFELRILLVQIDIKDPGYYLKDLDKIALLTDFTLILAWSYEEVGRYLETYKAYENKPPDAIMEKETQGESASETHKALFASCLLATKCGVNKTDCGTLYEAYKGSLANLILNSNAQEIEICPGFGSLKAQRLTQIFDAPFLN